MRRQLVYVWVIVWALMPVAVQAAEKEAVIDSIIVLAGFARQLDDVAGLAREEVEMRKAGLAPAEYARLQAVMGNAFAEKMLRADLRAELERHYDAIRYGEWLRLLESPQAKKMTQLEQRAASPQAARAIQRLAAHMHTKPPAKARVDLLRRLDAATGVTELALASQLAVSRAFLYAIEPGLLPDRRLSAKRLDDALAAMRIQVEPRLRDLALASGLYTYRESSDSALGAYVDMYEGGVGRWGAQITGEVMQTVLHRAVARARPALPPAR